MKTAAKVFTILGMIFTFWLIYPIILGYFILKKLDEATVRQELTTWGIIDLIFVSFLGGLFMLLIRDEDLR